MRITATCFPGSEDLLFDEVKKLGGKDIKKLRRAVSCIGDRSLVYKLNLYCHVALRVLVHLEYHRVKDEEEMYKAVHSIYWHKYFNVDQSFSVSAAFGRHNLRNTHFFKLKAKDAIVDRFQKEFGKRPSVDIKKPQIVVFLYFDNGHLDVYLDSSGYSLHKRGYKRFLGRASMNETLAAAMFYWSEWNPGTPVVNPMCGSGTLALESAFIMQGNSPQVRRTYFSFFNWKNFDQEIYDSIKKHTTGYFSERIYCSDNFNKSVKDCRDNIYEAGFKQNITVDHIDFFNLEPLPGSLILMNPPYDKRIQSKDVVGLYRKIGDTLKFKWKGCRATIISANLEAFKFIGLKPKKRYKVFNGQLPAEIRTFDLY